MSLVDDRLREVVATALDVLGLLAVAAGVVGGLWPGWGWWSLSAGGAVVLVVVAAYEVLSK